MFDVKVHLILWIVTGIEMCDVPKKVEGRNKSNLKIITTCSKHLLLRVVENSPVMIVITIVWLIAFGDLSEDQWEGRSRRGLMCRHEIDAAVWTRDVLTHV